jgi:hypothetical protein
MLRTIGDSLDLFISVWSHQARCGLCCVFSHSGAHAHATCHDVCLPFFSVVLHVLCPSNCVAQAPPMPLFISLT